MVELVLVDVLDAVLKLNAKRSMFAIILIADYPAIIWAKAIFNDK